MDNMYLRRYTNDFQEIIFLGNQNDLKGLVK